MTRWLDDVLTSIAVALLYAFFRVLDVLGLD